MKEAKRLGMYYKQIAVYKTTKALLEFVDDTRYDQEIMAWPHMKNSRIRINMKDYSGGKGDKAKDAFYNLSPEEFVRLIEAVYGVKQVSAVEKKRWDVTVDRFTKLAETYRQIALPMADISAMRELIEQFRVSQNELFSEAGEKMSSVFEQMVKQLSEQAESGARQCEKLTADAQKERDAAVKVREIYSDIKILNFDKYTNPEKEEERRVTAIRVAYAGYMDFPFLFEISNGWGKPLITRNNGVMIEEGSTHFDDVIKVYMNAKSLFPLLRRVDLFIRAMTTQGMQRYFERVSDPILNEDAET